MSRPTFDEPLLLEPVTKHYPWGKRGSASLVAQLSRQPIRDQPYAELWFGDHPSGAAQASWSGGAAPLNELTGQHAADLLGPNAAALFGPRLPFMFKILSVGEPLSIQLHPTRAQAALLHRRNPALYPDTNHKPEIAIALSKFTALHGFRSDLAQVLEGNAAWRTLIGEARLRDLRAALPKGYTVVLRQLVESLLIGAPTGLAAALNREVDETDPLRKKWRMELTRRYPGDPGILLFDLLNLVSLQPGDALITTAGTLHAYLEGDLLECMANSDNVVRAAFTSKQKDPATLMEVAAFEPLSPQPASSSATSVGVKTYQSFTPEFQVAVLTATDRELDLRSSPPQLFALLSGSAEIIGGAAPLKLLPGQGAFIPHCAAECSIRLNAGRAALVSPGKP